MDRNRLCQLLEAIRPLSIAVVGDFCLDVYWDIDMAASEASLETGLPTWPVAAQRVTLGGAGNVVNNLFALRVGGVDAYGAVGDDIWGREMLRQLEAAGASVGGIAIESTGWSTLVYIKPHVDSSELSRLDFGNFNSLPEDTSDRLITTLDACLDRYDAVIVNEQVSRGIHTPALRRNLAALIQRRPDKIMIVDSRHFSDAYPGAILKLNDHEAARLVGQQLLSGAPVPREVAADAAAAIYDRMWRRPVFVTQGSRGCVLCDSDGLHDFPAIPITSPIDTVGAGDSMLAGIALALATGSEAREAAELGNLVAAVTVQKLFVTGTATPKEVLAEYDRIPGNQ